MNRHHNKIMILKLSYQAGSTLQKAHALNIFWNISLALIIVWIHVPSSRPFSATPFTTIGVAIRSTTSLNHLGRCFFMSHSIAENRGDRNKKKFVNPRNVHEIKNNIVAIIADLARSYDAKDIYTMAATIDTATTNSNYSILQRMNQLHQSGHIKVKPNTDICNAIINSWATSTSTGAPNDGVASKKARAMLADMEHMYITKGVLDTKPNTITYNTVIKALAKSGGGAKAAIEAETLLQKMYHHHEVQPDVVTYSTVIHCWAKSGHSEAATRAEGILATMIQIYKSDPIKYADLCPNTQVFSTVIDAWAKSSGATSADTTTSAALKAQAILTDMEDVYYRSNKGLTKPNTITYNTVIQAWSKSGGGVDAAVAAERLLQKMNQLYDSGMNLSAKPNFRSYNTVIDCWAKVSSPSFSFENREKAARRAEDILNEMVRLYQLDPVKNADLRPKTMLFNTVVNSWAMVGSLKAATKAQSMLTNMERIYHDCEGDDIQPNTITYNIVIKALAKSGGGAHAALEAERLLQTMHRLHLAMTYSNNSKKLNVKPDVVTYGSVIDCWAKSNCYREEAAARAQSILSDMIGIYRSNPTLNANIRPGTSIYNAVINAWAKSESKHGASKAQSILNEMENCDVHHFFYQQPNTITYNTVINAWSKSGGGVDAAIEAEKLLGRMHHLHYSGNVNVKPNAITYGLVINSWARHSAERADDILSKMIRIYQSDPIRNTDLKPNARLFSIVITAWAKSKESASRAERLLIELERWCDDEEVHWEKLNNSITATYSTVINALAKSSDRGAAVRAERILLSMHRQYTEEGNKNVKPDTYAYNSVINACALTSHEEDKEEAFTIAFRVFQHMTSTAVIQGIRPDGVTYNFLLKACHHLIPRKNEERRYFAAKSIFEMCCEAGFVDGHVLSALRRTISEKQYGQLVGIADVGLPKAWTRKVTNAVGGYKVPIART